MQLALLSPFSLEFPPFSAATPYGLLAAGGDLSLPRMQAAYNLGIFPWYGSGEPILWWSPDPRCVLFPEKLHVPGSLRRVINSRRFSFTINSMFRRVMEECAAATRSGQSGETWISEDIIAAYVRMHEAGLAHSVEVWQDGELAGGLYGVALGKAFFGESMFYLKPDASKAGIVWLVRKLHDLGYMLIDCQQETEHMLRFGAESIPRAEFLKILEKAKSLPGADSFFSSQIEPR